jgi:hypothetical protein
MVRSVDQSDGGQTVQMALAFGDKVDIELLGKAAKSLRTLLTDIEQVITGEAHASWEWEQPALRAFASPNGTTEATLLQVVHEAREALVKGEAEQRSRRVQWPETITPKGQRAVKDIIALLGSVDTITVQAEKEDPVTLRRQDEFLAVLPRRQARRERSEVEGILDIINVRRQPRFSVKQRSGGVVGCTFPTEMFERVKDSLGSTVVVEGLVKYRTDGTPVSVTEITNMRIKAPPAASITELRGTLPGLTNGQPAGEYVRQMREEDDSD